MYTINQKEKRFLHLIIIIAQWFVKVNINLQAGIEIGVASTKTFTAKLTILFFMMLKIAE